MTLDFSVTDTLKMQAQQVLNELDRKDLLPFTLTAMAVESLRPNNYTIYFYDSRLPSVSVSWVEGQSFKDLFRVVIQNRVSEMLK